MNGEFQGRRFVRTGLAISVPGYAGALRVGNTRKSGSAQSGQKRKVNGSFGGGGRIQPDFAAIAERTAVLMTMDLRKNSVYSSYILTHVCYTSLFSPLLANRSRWIF